MVVTCTWGGTMLGYCASGMINSDSRPAIVVTSAMTMASRGRSTKIAENIDLASVQGWRRRAGLYCHPRSQCLKPLDDELLAAGQAPGDDDVGTAGAAGGDPSDGHLAVLDNEDVDTLLICH